MLYCPVCFIFDMLWFFIWSLKYSALSNHCSLALLCYLYGINTQSKYSAVIEHGLCKQLCLKMFPEISGVAHIIELDNIIEPLSNTLGSYVSWESHKRNHRVYAFLASGLTPMRKNCISKAISASSTDNYPEESILHTLEPGDRTEYRASYWSSKGESDPSVPETLVYELASKLCLVTEIYVHPFQG